MRRIIGDVTDDANADVNDNIDDDDGRLEV